MAEATLVRQPGATLGQQDGYKVPSSAVNAQGSDSLETLRSGGLQRRSVSVARECFEETHEEEVMRRLLYAMAAVTAAALGVGALGAPTAGSSMPDSLAGLAAPGPAARASTPAAIAPKDFTDPVENPWFPLDPGMVTRLRGRDEEGRYLERVRVTGRTRMIQGVAARVVRDVVRRTDGSLAEFTTDWYAADNAGNVWYLGERTATFDRRGHVESRDGTWLAGRDGARAGLIMTASPGAADAYRQELYRGHAEDQAWVVGFKRSVRVPAGRYRHLLRVYEWTRLEPRVISLKLYAQGVGIVAERDVAGGHEEFELTALRRR